jgi:hypothetical protein
LTASEEQGRTPPKRTHLFHGALSLEPQLTWLYGIYRQVNILPGKVAYHISHPKKEPFAA